MFTSTAEARAPTPDQPPPAPVDADPVAAAVPPSASVRHGTTASSIGVVVPVDSAETLAVVLYEIVGGVTSDEGMGGGEKVFL